ncbi:hypothetical protein [Brachyspira pulli]|uniref:hypothetical protein n=1 Tax=Brachyspira pulli TaxID=310721 RepID=UPI0030072AAD
MFKKNFILILSIILISCNSPYNIHEPDRVIAVDGSGGIDLNKANIRVTTRSYRDLPIRIIIIDSYNKEISIGQLTTADDVNPDVVGDHTYSKIFTFIPGTYTLILRPYVGYEMRFENISFSAGSLEEYEY